MSELYISNCLNGKCYIAYDESQWKNEVLIHVTTWINIENILNERSWAKRPPRMKSSVHLKSTKAVKTRESLGKSSSFQNGKRHFHTVGTVSFCLWLPSVLSAIHVGSFFSSPFCSSDLCVCVLMTTPACFGHYSWPKFTGPSERWPGTVDWILMWKLLWFPHLCVM